VVIGRTVDPVDRPGFVGLGTCNKLSREHAVIMWHPDRQEWALTVLSKNGAWVNRMTHKQGDVIPLKHRTPIRMGTVRFFFMLPQDP